MLQFNTIEVKRLRNQLVEVGEHNNGGKFTAEDGTIVAGGEELRDLYSRCLKWSDLVLDRSVFPQTVDIK